MRTPKAQVGGQDSLMQQAANLAKLRDLQTPLLGGENPELAGLDYSGIVPQKGVVQTPNPLAAAAAAAGVTPGPGYGATPIARGAAGAGGAVGGLLGATPGRAGEHGDQLLKSTAATRCLHCLSDFQSTGKHTSKCCLRRAFISSFSM